MGKSAKELKNVYEADDISIGIPCLVNTNDLDAGDELVMFKAVEEKKTASKRTLAFSPQQRKKSNA